MTLCPASASNLATPSSEPLLSIHPCKAIHVWPRPNHSCPAITPHGTGISKSLTFTSSLIARSTIHTKNSALRKILDNTMEPDEHGYPTTEKRHMNHCFLINCLIIQRLGMLYYYCTSVPFKGSTIFIVWSSCSPSLLSRYCRMVSQGSYLWWQRPRLGCPCGRGGRQPTSRTRNRGCYCASPWPASRQHPRTCRAENRRPVD